MRSIWEGLLQGGTIAMHHWSAASFSHMESAESIWKPKARLFLRELPCSGVSMAQGPAELLLMWFRMFHFIDCHFVLGGTTGFGGTGFGGKISAAWLRHERFCSLHCALLWLNDLQSGCRTFFESSPYWYPRRMYAARWSWMRSALWFQFQQKEASQAAKKRESPGIGCFRVWHDCVHTILYIVHIAEPLRWRYKLGTVILQCVGCCRMVLHPCEMDNVFASGSASHSVQAVPAQMPVPWKKHSVQQNKSIQIWVVQRLRVFRSESMHRKRRHQSIWTQFGELQWFLLCFCLCSAQCPPLAIELHFLGLLFPLRFCAFSPQFSQSTSFVWDKS